MQSWNKSLLWYSFEVEVKDQSLVDVKLFFHQLFLGRTNCILSNLNEL